MRGDVARWIFGLARRRMRERAQAVETLLAVVVDMCKETVKEVFDEGGAAEEKGGARSMEEMYKPVGGDAVLAESIEAAKMKKVAPFMGPFERLTLLGA